MKRGVSSLFRLTFKEEKPDIKLLLEEANNLLYEKDYPALNELYKRIERAYKKLSEKERMEIEHKLVDLYYDMLIARLNDRSNQKNYKPQ